MLRPGRIAPLVIHVYDIADPLPRLHVAAEVVPVTDAAEGARQAAVAGFLQRGGAAVEGLGAAGGTCGHVDGTPSGPGRQGITVDADSDQDLDLEVGQGAGGGAARGLL